MTTDLTLKTAPAAPAGRPDTLLPPAAGDRPAGRYPDDDARWRAVLAHDPEADGVFFYGVRSTGVYCRPTCPARRPRRDRVAFFDTPAAAARAGFRSCRRCRPDEVSERQQMVARVRTLLETLEPAPTLGELGQLVGLSPSHVQRVFRQVTGLSPREYATAHRLQRLKDRLKDGTSVTEALYDAGYGSSRALYEAAGEGLGMSPGAYRKGGSGQRIAYAVTDSPLGRLLIAATGRGICALQFGDDGVVLEELRREFPNATLVDDPEAVAPYTRAVLDHLAGQRPRLDLPLDARGTAFQERVWAALRAIPYGETRSYGELASMIGEPRAVRAVAQACARNPVAIVVPCHRVVQASGAPGGYRWGVERKETLLRRERATAPRS